MRSNCQSERIRQAGTPESPLGEQILMHEWSEVNQKLPDTPDRERIPPDVCNRCADQVEIRIFSITPRNAS